MINSFNRTESGSGEVWSLEFRSVGGLGSAGGRLVAGVLGAAVLLGSSGCNNALEGGLSGAGLGALAGMGIGSLSGNMGKGAALGAIAGGLGGAILGDQNQRSSSYWGRSSRCD